MTVETQTAPGGAAAFRSEFGDFWRGIPDKGLFSCLLAGWVALFHFLGNTTFGYTKTASLFGWLHYAYGASTDDEHGYIIPFVVLGLFWWKRAELLAVPKKHWWPALLLFVFALLLHIAGYMVQQTRISVIAFFMGVYGLMGVVWGPRWLRASFFPYLLFAFCLPLNTVVDTITFPLRLLATHITSALCHTALGINVIQDGTRIFDAAGAYQYEVAAACSGIRSLTAIFALTTVYGFMTFRSPWRTALIIASAFPLAVAANVLRLLSIIIASEVFSPAAGQFVHQNSWISLLPYVPAIVGMLVIGHWLREARKAPTPPQAMISEAAQSL
jgi:exosortase